MDKSTDAITARLNGRQHAFVPGHPGALKPRSVVAAHAGVQSVGTVSGRKPKAHDCADGGCNKAANQKFNDAVSNPRETTKPGQLVAAGITGNFGR